MLLKWQGTWRWQCVELSLWDYLEMAWYSAITLVETLHSHCWFISWSWNFLLHTAWQSACTTGENLMTRLENVLERKKMLFFLLWEEVGLLQIMLYQVSVLLMVFLTNATGYNTVLWGTLSCGNHKLSLAWRNPVPSPTPIYQFPSTVVLFHCRPLCIHHPSWLPSLFHRALVHTVQSAFADISICKGLHTFAVADKNFPKYFIIPKNGCRFSFAVGRHVSKNM